jgi:hypothetical protein
VSPAVTTTYVLNAMAKRGEPVKRSIRVEVLPPPPAPVRLEVSMFDADPGVVRAGEAARLRWRVSGASAVEVQPALGMVKAEDMAPVSPRETTRYVLTARGPDGSRTSASTTVTVLRDGASGAPRPVLELTASAARVAPDGRVTLRWTAQNLGRVTLLPKFGAVRPQGSMEVLMHATTTFRLTGVTANRQTIERELTVVVDPALAVRNNTAPGRPVVNFTANPATIPPGGTATLAWNVQNAQAVFLEGVGRVPVQNQYAVRPAATTTYRLTVTGPDGQNYNALTTVTVAQGGNVPQPRGTAIELLHYHGGAGLTPWGVPQRQQQGGFCQGTLYLDGKAATFRARGTNHGFSATRVKIAEVKTNRMSIEGQGAFHVKLTTGENFNFVPQRMSAREAVELIQRLVP